MEQINYPARRLADTLEEARAMSPGVCVNTLHGYEPRYRLMRNPLRATWQVVCMLRYDSIFAHIIFEGTIEEVTSFYNDCGGLKPY